MKIELIVNLKECFNFIEQLDIRMHFLQSENTLHVRSVSSELDSFKITMLSIK